MITISGQRLTGYEIHNINPFDRPLHTILYSIPFIIFTWYSLQFFRNLDRGVTLALPKTGFSLPKVFAGKIKKNSDFRLQHFDNPLLTGILGLIFFAAAEFFLVIMFKALDYTFLIN
mgnify:CR=1 FL=1